jgi:hypothetical protein
MTLIADYFMIDILPFDISFRFTTSRVFVSLIFRVSIASAARFLSIFTLQSTGCLPTKCRQLASLWRTSSMPRLLRPPSNSLRDDYFFDFDYFDFYRAFSYRFTINNIRNIR